MKKNIIILLLFVILIPSILLNYTNNKSMPDNESISYPSFIPMDRPFGENLASGPSRVCQTLLEKNNIIEKIKQGYNENEKLQTQADSRMDKIQGDYNIFTRGTLSEVSMYLCSKDNMVNFVAYGDLDGDYLSEVLLADLYGNYYLYWNNGINFKKQKLNEIIAGPLPSGAFLFADYNGDNLNDIIIIPSEQNMTRDLILIKNNGNRNFSFVRPSIKTENVSGIPNSITTDDINKDGIADIVVTIRKTYNMARNNAEQYPARIFISTKGKAPYYVEKTTSMLPTLEKSLSIAQGSGPTPEEGAPETIVADKFIHFEPYVPILHDFDNDGQIDLFIAADFAGSRIFFQENGKFIDYSNSSTINSSGAGMGAEIYDFNNDGLLDIFTTEKSYTYSNCSYDRPCDYKNIGNAIFINKGDRTFVGSGTWDSQIFKNIEKYKDRYSDFDPGLRMTGFSWGFASMDYNMDGLRDYFIGVGQVSISRSGEDWASSLEKPTLFIGKNDGTWEDATGEIFRTFNFNGTTTPTVLSTDFNGDFRPDILVASSEMHKPHLLINSTVNNNNSASLVIKGRGIGASPNNGEGAIVEIKVKNLPTQLFKYPSKTSNYQVYSSTAPLVVGLGKNDIAEVTVKFPSGKKITNIIVKNKINIIKEPK